MLDHVKLCAMSRMTLEKVEVTFTTLAQAFKNSVPVKYKKSGDIDVAEITFTTAPATDVDHRPSVNRLNYYGGKNNKLNYKKFEKPDLVTKNKIFGPDTNRAPVLFTPTENDLSSTGKYYQTDIKLRGNYKVPNVNNIFEPADRLPYGKSEGHKDRGTVQPSGNNLRPSALIESTPKRFKNEDYGTVVTAPPDILKHYSTKVPSSSRQEFSSINRYLQPRKQGKRISSKKIFVPITTSGSRGFFDADLSSITSENDRKIGKITESPSLIPEFNKKDLNSQKAAKKPIYPKKFISVNSKKLNVKTKVKPVQEINEPSIEQHKSTVPNNFYKEPVQSNSFSHGLSSFLEPARNLDSGLGPYTEPGPAPIRDEGEFSKFTDSALLRGGGGERVEFQMYGMDGPHSYKFGYDTGRGHNRHFRFEERDSNGKVRGHYGYLDKDGKMRMMKYEADPHTGFRAGPMDHPPNNFN